MSSVLDPIRPEASPAETDLRVGDRWVAAVLVSLVAPGVLAVIGAPGVLVALVGVSVALVEIGDRVASLIRGQNRRVRGALEDGLEREQLLRSDERFAGKTHGFLTEALGVLEAAARALSIRGEGERGPAWRAVSDTAVQVSALEADLVRSTPQRGTARRRGRASTVGGLVADRDSDDEERRRAMKRYGDPANLPSWVPGARFREGLTRFGDVLDDVRHLHSREIEYSVLLFTLWSRMLLVGSAPLLAALSFGRVPLEGGFSWRDVPWAIAVAVSAGGAAVAPWLAATVMRDDEPGRRWRRILLTVEIPVAAAAIVATPAWPVVVFAAGWTNWWQRPTFDWIKFAAWVGAVATLLAVGMLTADATVPDVVFELAISMFVIAVTGGSYGAMLPVSASVMARVIVGGLLVPRRARRDADRQVQDVLRDLRGVELALLAEHPPQTHDAEKIHDIADELERRIDRGDRRARRTPQGLSELLPAALERGGPGSSSERATYLKERARLVGDPAPVTIDPFIARDDGIKRLRFTTRPPATALARFIVEVVGEARRHGTGRLTTIVWTEGDQIVLRFVNTIKSERREGRLSGANRLDGLAARFDGTVAHRGAIDGTTLGVRYAKDSYMVEVSFSRRHLDETPR